ncbi:MAG: hypothetical protein V1737_02330 [Chloroflexota bacterium]
MTAQLDLFKETKVEIGRIEHVQTVTLGKRSVRIPLQKQRRAAIARLVEVLTELEGKSVYVGTYDAGGRHFWVDNLKLDRLSLDFYPPIYKADVDHIPSVIVMYGRRDACIRIFTDYLVAVRTQEYQGYWHYLLDFRNGFWQSPIDNFRSHYACLHITRFKD